MKVETESLEFSKDITLKHYDKINPKFKKKFNAVEFKNLIYGSHLSGIAEMLQIMLTIGEELEDEKYSDRERFDLLIGELEMMWITAGEEFCEKFPKMKNTFPRCIETLKKTKRESWSMRIEKGRPGQPLHTHSLQET